MRAGHIEAMVFVRADSGTRIDALQLSAFGDCPPFGENPTAAPRPFIRSYEKLNISAARSLLYASVEAGLQP
jgi:hypothetical protein